MVEKVREGEKAREESQAGRRVDAFPSMCVCIDAIFVCRVVVCYRSKSEKVI